jgi:hypothetical protein
MGNMIQAQWDHTKLGSVIDTVCKTVRDTLTGALYIWRVVTDASMNRSVVISLDQNPNQISGVLFKHLFVNADIANYQIQTTYRNIYNVVAVYGGTDPVTGMQVFGVYSDPVSISDFGRTIETSITVNGLMSVAAAQAYAEIYLDLNAYPVATGGFDLLQPDPTILEGTWMQIWEAPGDGVNAPSIKQVRCGQVVYALQNNGTQIKQSISPNSPAPYLDDAIYKMGMNVKNAGSIANKALSTPKQTLFIRVGGTVQSGHQPAISGGAWLCWLTPCEAVFPPGVNEIMTDVSYGVGSITLDASPTAVGQYTVSAQSNGTWLVTKGDRPANTPTSQNVLSVWLQGTAASCVDIRTLIGQPGFSTLTTPALASGHPTVSLPAPANAGSGAYDQPFDFWLDPAVWTNANASFAYLEIGALVHGSAQQISIYTTLQPSATGEYVGTVPGLGAGTLYDLYVRAHDNIDRPTAFLLLGTTLTNPLTISSLAWLTALLLKEPDYVVSGGLVTSTGNGLGVMGMGIGELGL